MADPVNGKEVQAHLSALGDFLSEAFPGATELFEQGLHFLVGRLDADRASMSRVTPSGLETTWSTTAPKVASDTFIHGAEKPFCLQVMEHPQRMLVIHDLKRKPELSALGVRSYLGIALGEPGRHHSVLSILCARVHDWTPLEIVLVKAVAALFSKTLEVELLRDELETTRTILDITTAVVEDSALESSATRLPNRHYLEVWLKAQLYLARRRDEVIAVAQWRIPPDLESRKHLQDIAHGLRGEDLLADLGQTCLLLLPRTNREGLQTLLDRIRTVLGPLPVGATLWLPQHPVDRDDLLLQQVIQRTAEALRISQEAAQDGPAEVHWILLEMGPTE